MHFGKCKGEPSAESKRKRLKAELKEPRLASYDVACAWQNAMVAHYGKHFGDFPAEGEDMALLCLDECSSNTCSFYFWRDRCEIMIEAVWDDSHRRKHDVETVIHEAGYGVVVAKAHIRNNVSYRPWQGKGYLKYMEEDAADTKGFACKDFAFCAPIL